MVTRRGVPSEENELGINPFPLMVRVNLALPAGAEAGLRLVIRGCDGVTVKVSGAEVPPAVVTVTLTGPAVAIRLAGTSAERIDPCR